MPLVTPQEDLRQRWTRLGERVSTHGFWLAHAVRDERAVLDWLRTAQELERELRDLTRDSRAHLLPPATGEAVAVF